MTDTAAITASLEAVLAVTDDPGRAVYARLFADYPETEALFFLDRDGRRRDNMLSRTFETLIDYLGDRKWSVSMLQCERINHEELGVSPAIYTRFFVVMRDAFRDALGAGWLPNYESAWHELLVELDAVANG